MNTNYKGDPIYKIGYKKGILSGIVLSAVDCVLLYCAKKLKFVEHSKNVSGH